MTYSIILNVVLAFSIACLLLRLRKSQAKAEDWRRTSARYSEDIRRIAGRLAEAEIEIEELKADCKRYRHEMHVLQMSEVQTKFHFIQGEGDVPELQKFCPRVDELDVAMSGKTDDE